MISGARERTSERKGAQVRASEASSTEQENELGVWANKQADERVVHYLTRRILIILTQSEPNPCCAIVLVDGQTIFLCQKNPKGEPFLAILQLSSYVQRREKK